MRSKTADLIAESRTCLHRNRKRRIGLRQLSLRPFAVETTIGKRVHLYQFFLILNTTVQAWTSSLSSGRHQMADCSCRMCSTITLYKSI